MEKSAIVTNEKVRKHIPNDLYFSILSKLSLKSLKRFGCVCKSWVLLFENPNFMSIYRNNFIHNNLSYYNDTSLLLQEISLTFSSLEQSVFYLLSGERFENRVKLDLPPPFYDDTSNIRILGSVGVNGTLCLSQLKTTFLFWNPTTGDFKVVPPSSVESKLLHSNHLRDVREFGYDHVRDDYKIIRRVVFLPLYVYEYNFGMEQLWNSEDLYDAPLWELYSLRSNSWKTLDVKLPKYIREIRCARLYMDEMCHWWGGNNDKFNIECLVSFDMIKEVFFTTLMPSYMDKSLYFGFVHMVLLNGSIAFISNNEETTTFYISILGELGVMESWTKLFIVDLLPYVERPIEAGKKGIIFFKREREYEGLSWFDLSTQMIEEVDMKRRHIYHNVVIYKKNSLPIERLIN